MLSVQNRTIGFFSISDTTVGVSEESELIYSLKVYPNPSSGNVIFEIENVNSGFGNNGNIIIRNIFGQVVDIISIDNVIDKNGSKYEWDTQNLAKGMYIFTLQVNSRTQSGKNYFGVVWF